MPDEAFRAIVVGTDGSPHAQRAVDRAVQLAAGSGAQLHLVTAYHDGWHVKERLGNTAQTATVDLRRVAEEALARAAGHVRAQGLEVQEHATEGDPAEALIRVAEETGADLIVVGSRGLNTAQRFLLGSVSQKVSHHAHTTVMVVRGDDA